MSARELLLVSVVMGLLAVGTAASVGRIRREATYRPSSRRVPRLAGGTVAGSSTVRSDTVGLGLVALLAVFLVATAVVDTALVAVVALATAILGYFAWGVYSLARLRGLPRAHAVGLSVWLFGVVLIGVVAVQLLVG